mmetsp:Transcript_27331/g.44382  ORF Transcript_27331/g.44382 Transcript_27331/m.44382 type:complete len:97 (+) Transcript_27331:605-895(+)
MGLGWKIPGAQKGQCEQPNGATLQGRLEIPCKQARIVADIQMSLICVNFNYEFLQEVPKVPIQDTAAVQSPRYLLLSGSSTNYKIRKFAARMEARI